MFHGVEALQHSFARSRALALAAALAAGAPPAFDVALSDETDETDVLEPPAFDVALKDGRSMDIRVHGPLGASKLEASGEAVGALELTAAAASLTDEYLMRDAIRRNQTQSDAISRAAAASLTDEYLEELASTVILIGSVLDARIR